MRWATTNWTQVLAAREAPTDASRLALETLCQAYWYPIYTFVRGQGLDAEDARDATQAYFAQLLEKDYLEDCDPARGRFRVFLMTSIRNFLSKEREKSRTWKRGGRATVLSLDADAEGRYRDEPVESAHARRRLRTPLGAHAARTRARAAAHGGRRRRSRPRVRATETVPDR